MFINKVTLLLLLLFAFRLYSSSEDSLYIYGKGSGTFVNIYQKYLSGIDGRGNCPMYPSCSQYAKASLKKQGNTFKALCETSKRLIECGKDHHTFQRITTKNGPKLLDLPHNESESSFLHSRNSPPLYQSSFPHQDYRNTLTIADYLFKLKDYTKASEYYLNALLFCNDTYIKEISKIKFLNSSFFSMPLEQFTLHYAHLSTTGKDTFNTPLILDYLYALKLYNHGDYNRSRRYTPIVDSTDLVLYKKTTLLRTANYIRGYNFDKAVDESKKLPSPILPAVINGTKEKLHGV